VILVILLLYKPQTTMPGIVLVVVGVPVYFFLRARTKRYGQDEAAATSPRASNS
jgi:hypothetical protein